MFANQHLRFIDLFDVSIDLSAAFVLGVAGVVLEEVTEGLTGQLLAGNCAALGGLLWSMLAGVVVARQAAVVARSCRRWWTRLRKHTS